MEDRSRSAVQTADKPGQRIVRDAARDLIIAARDHMREVGWYEFEKYKNPYARDTSPCSVRGAVDWAYQQLPEECRFDGTKAVAMGILHGALNADRRTGPTLDVDFNNVFVKGDVDPIALFDAAIKRLTP